MRLDKFLKVSRIIKRRTVAKEFCDAGKISINKKEAKASDKVSEGDILQVIFGSRIMEYEVLSVKDHASKEDAKLMVKEI